MRLVVTFDQLTSIQAAAQAAWPAEACGLLVGVVAGDSYRVRELVEAANLKAFERHDRFELDPAVHIATLRRLRGSDSTILGHWHSHPGGAAVPSMHDVAAATDAELLWLIVAVDEGRAGEAAAWRIDPPTNQVAAVTLVVEKTP